MRPRSATAPSVGLSVLTLIWLSNCSAVPLGPFGEPIRRVMILTLTLYVPL